MNQKVVTVGGRIFFTCWWSFYYLSDLRILTFLAKVDVCLASPMDSCFIPGCRWKLRVKSSSRVFVRRLALNVDAIWTLTPNLRFVIHLKCNSSCDKIWNKSQIAVSVLFHQQKRLKNAYTPKTRLYPPLEPNLKYKHNALKLKCFRPLVSRVLFHFRRARTGEVRYLLRPRKRHAVALYLSDQ